MPTWVSFLIFQSGWFLIVAGHDTNFFWLIMPVMIFYVLLEKFKQSPSPKIYLGRLFILSIGFAFDTALNQLRIIQFTDSLPLVPGWLFILWCWFALNFSDSFSWLKNRAKMAIGLGALFGPLAYFGASRLSDVSINSPIYFSLISGLFWALLFFIAFNQVKLTAYFFKS